MDKHELCTTSPDNFCLICGSYVQKKNRFVATKILGDYEGFFRRKIEVSNRFIPKTCCATCYRNFGHLKRGSREFPFTSPVVWSRPKSRNDCYFCQFGPGQCYGTIVYPKVCSVAPAVKRDAMASFTKNTALVLIQRPLKRPAEIDHGGSMKRIKQEQVKETNKENLRVVEELPKRNATKRHLDKDLVKMLLWDEQPPLKVTKLDESDHDFVPTDYLANCQASEVQKLSQGALNNFLKQLPIPKRVARTLMRKLRAANFLAEEVTFDNFQNAYKEFLQYFTYDQDTEICYCHDILALMARVDPEFKAEDYRLSIDATRKYLNVALIHNTNKKKSVPVAFSRNPKETYERVRFILGAINYYRFNFFVIGDLKMIAIIRGLMQGYPLHNCAWCLFNSRDTAKHYSRHVWSPRPETVDKSKSELEKNCNFSIIILF